MPRYPFKVVVKKSKLGGEGCFANREIRKGEIIEGCPYILVPKSDVDTARKTVLDNYLFMRDDGQAVIALGYGSKYNHSYWPNARYDYRNNMLMFTAIDRILPGQEITVNYNGDPADVSKVWFDVQ